MPAKLDFIADVSVQNLIICINSITSK